MGGELLKPAPGVLVLRLDGGVSALFGLLVEETHFIHGGRKAQVPSRFRPGAALPPLDSVHSHAKRAVMPRSDPPHDQSSPPGDWRSPYPLRLRTKPRRKPKGGEAERGPVEPPRPRPMSGGAAAELEFDD